uniref:Sushi domain-containing protein n=1 Tax=Meleagris gallopavo TaxID=9103 RepID=A0A803YSJ7_MELGA
VSTALGCMLGSSDTFPGPIILSHPRRSSCTAGACGPPPHMTHSQPSGVEQLSSFPVGSRVTYTCLYGAIRIPGLLDTVQCLPGSRWSDSQTCSPWLPVSCTTPTTLHFAALSKVDEMINFYPVGFTVSYVCRPGYENISESQPTSTCLENLMWSEVPELCQRSAGSPSLPVQISSDILAGFRRSISHSLILGLSVTLVLAFRHAVITCSSPPRISNGRHDGEGVEKFAYNSTVTYSCDSGFQLIGNVSIRCTRADNARGVWSGAVPQCKGDFLHSKTPTPSLPLLRSPGSQVSPAQPIGHPAELTHGTHGLFPFHIHSPHSFPCFSSMAGSCATSALKFVMPLYKTQSSFSPGTHKRSPCSPKYRSISAVLPKAGCSENTWWSKAAAFCGSECLICLPVVRSDAAAHSPEL